MNTRQKTKIAKNLFKKSLKNSSVDPKKVTAILKSLTASKPQGLIGILKVYKRLIETRIATETLTIESPMAANKLKKLESELLKKTSAKRTVHITNTNLIIGAKITNGDWVWEDTLATKLKQMSEITN